MKQRRNDKKKKKSRFCKISTNWFQNNIKDVI